MAHKKRLQVFVSSTFADLREERQAAVEAILASGHIPAGMELFAAGDESQMNVIRRWIDESDVFSLILGGRYGSIEPKSQKSYIHLEYEYALERQKPLFAVVITPEHLEEKVRLAGTRVIELDYPEKLKQLRSLVMSRLVKFWSDPRDIKLAIQQTLAEFSQRTDLVGWIPGAEAVHAAALAEEVARLRKENAELHKALEQNASVEVTYNGLTFEQLYRLLLEEKINIEELGESGAELMRKVAKSFGDSEPAIIHAFWLFRDDLAQGGFIPDSDKLNTKIVGIFERYGLVQHSREQKDFGNLYRFTPVGQQFMLRLALVKGSAEAMKYTL